MQPLSVSVKRSTLFSKPVGDHILNYENNPRNFKAEVVRISARNFGDRWQKMHQQELFEELHALMSALELERTIFRSDHISNTLVLKGVLGKDKQKLLDHIQLAMNKPTMVPLRSERKRSL